MELKINQCERYDSTGMIFKVAYQFYIDANDGTRTSHYGVSSFEGDPTSPTYVEVSDITEENVKTWVKSNKSLVNLNIFKYTLISFIDIIFLDEVKIGMEIRMEWK